MCFVIKTQSPQEKIDILFANEAIWFGYYGKNVLLADLIIKNVGEKDINELTIVYPREFIKSKDNGKNHKEEKEHIYKFNKIGSFQDRSGQWLDKDSEWNRFLELASFKKFNPNKETEEIEIEFINRDAIWERNSGPSINGTIYNNPCALILYPDLPIYNIAAAADLGYTLLQYNTAAKPIKINEVRFLRWAFFPEHSTIYNPPFFHSIYLDFLNEMYCHYNIAGPHELYHWFIERIEIEISKQTTDKAVKSTLIAVRNLIKKDTGEVKYNFWRFMLFSLKLRALFNFYKNGNIEPLGGLQNITDDIPDPPGEKKPSRKGKHFFSKNRYWRRRAYYWEAQANTPFFLYFTAKKHNRWYKILPYVALLFCLPNIIQCIKIGISFILRSLTNIFSIIIVLFNYLANENPIVGIISAISVIGGAIAIIRKYFQKQPK